MAHASYVVKQLNGYLNSPEMLQLAHQIVTVLAKGLVEYHSPNGRLDPVVTGDPIAGNLNACCHGHSSLNPV